MQPWRFPTARAVGMLVDEEAATFNLQLVDVDIPVDIHRASEARQAAPMDTRYDRRDRSANHWNERLQEDNAHYIVNEDDQMYDDIDKPVLY